MKKVFTIKTNRGDFVKFTKKRRNKLIDVTTYINDLGGRKTDQEMSADELLKLFNLYSFIKINDIRSRIINPNGKNEVTKI